MSPRLHTDFVEVTVHTAKCDSCDKHNKLKLYRCTECGQHVCSLCWSKKSGDITHEFGGRFRDMPELNASLAVEVDKTSGKRDGESKRKASSRRRVHVISDDEDDDLLVLKPTSTTENAEVNETSEQQKKRKNIIMNDNRGEDHEDDLPRLWPMVPTRRLPVLRPAVPAANTSATESANQVTQRNPHTHREESDSERQRFYDNLGRQTMASRYAFVDDQETNTQASRPSQSSIPHQQATLSAPLHEQRVIYRPPPGTDVDRQAARYQWAFQNSPPTDRQAPRPTQPLNAHQQATQLAPRRTQSAIHRPRPGTDRDQQAARNELAFANPQHFDHQTPQPSQASISHQQAVRPAPRPAQTAISQQQAQTPTNLDQVAARRQEAFRLNQQAQAYADAKQMDARNRQNLSSHHDARPAVNRDQVAAHNQQAFISNQQSSAAAKYAEQIMAARDQQEAYLSRQQANRPSTGPAQSSVSHGRATGSSRFPSQAFLSQQYAALQASRQAQHRIATQQRLQGSSGRVQIREPSPEILTPADVHLFYAGVEQVPELRFRSDQDTNGVSQLLSAADHLEKASTASPKSRSSSKPLVEHSGAAGTPSVSSRGPALNASPRSTDADSAKARIDKHRARLAELHSSASTRNTVSKSPASLQGHPSYRHTTTQPTSGPALANSPAAQSHGSSFRRAQSLPGPSLPVSDHAATYINQWNSGRAALSSSSNRTAAAVPATQPDHPRSPIPALDPRSTVSVQDMVASGTKEGEVAGAGSQALSAPIGMSGETKDVDRAMGSPSVKILEDGETRHKNAQSSVNNTSAVEEDKNAEKARTETPEPISGLHTDKRAEKHQRGEEEGDGKTSKEQKGSDDVDVVDARMRNSKEKHLEQIDDDSSDLEITSWNKLDSNKSTEKSRGTKAGAKGPESGRTIKKGVAQVKKPEPKGRKGKKSATNIGTIG